MICVVNSEGAAEVSTPAFSVTRLAHVAWPDGSAVPRWRCCFLRRCTAARKARCVGLAIYHGENSFQRGRANEIARGCARRGHSHRLWRVRTERPLGLRPRRNVPAPDSLFLLPILCSHSPAPSRALAAFCQRFQQIAEWFSTTYRRLRRKYRTWSKCRCAPASAARTPYRGRPHSL